MRRYETIYNGKGGDANGISECLRVVWGGEDLSRQELAGYLQISRGSYTNYEIGARGIPAEVLIKLADYYNVGIDYLVGRTKNPKKE